MAMSINTNINSLTAQRSSGKVQDSLSTAMARLSSGLRINSAKDDAAGLAISERFTTQIRGLNQAARNANDGISLAQTAEGALASVSDNLQRMRELAVQSANATNSASDRAALQQEVSQLSSEIDRVATQTQFNGINLLDGTFTAQQFQVGANANQTITIASIASARTSSLGQSYGAALTGTTLTAATGITSAATGVTAADNGGAITLSATDGRNITSSLALGTATNAAKQDIGLGTVAATPFSSYNLSYTGTNALVIAGTAANTVKGLTNGSTSAAATGTAISLIDVSTVSGANTALTSIDAALTSV